MPQICEDIGGSNSGVEGVNGASRLLRLYDDYLRYLLSSCQHGSGIECSRLLCVMAQVWAMLEKAAHTASRRMLIEENVSQSPYLLFISKAHI